MLSELDPGRLYDVRPHGEPADGQPLAIDVGDPDRAGAPYRNTYLTRFDVTDGEIVRMAEYGNVMMYARLGVRPNRAEFRSLLRAVGRMLSPTRSSRSGR